MKARIFVTLKPAVLDPQGKAVRGALHSLGYTEAADVRVGKLIELDLAGFEQERDKAAATARVKEMCEKLLANTVIEQYRIEIVAE
ncbi:MAG TPA: phosphoribosylformylglycinamidine synthase subunit PurS [Candidatus Polarisedimenticolia bacterium]|nr:phosphoribosylformylglycinamidine synthase subunit PurS [Candidatus Polarisedimenticolia bacterium]